MSKKKERILVTGASGRTGRAVISALSGHKNIIRAFVRRTEVSEELRNLGANEVVVGDLFDFEHLVDAVSGCCKVIHICPPMHPGEADLAMKMTDTCRQCNVERLVLYSVLHPLLSDVRHHSLKLKAEEYLVNAGQCYTIVQPGRYMQHHIPIWAEIMETGKHRMPFNIKAKFNIVDLADLAEAVAKILIEEGHEAASYQLAGPQPLSQIDMAKIISNATGKNVEAEIKSTVEFCNGAKKAGMSNDRIEQLCIMNAHYDKHGLIGNSNVLEWILGRKPTDFATYITDNFLKH